MRRFFGSIQDGLDRVVASRCTDMGDMEPMWRLRLLNMTGLMLVVLAVLWAVSFWSHQAFLVGAFIFSMAAIEVGLLLLLRCTGRTRLVAHVTIFMLLAGGSLSNWSTGGLEGANIVVFFIAPVAGLTLLGRRGLVWVGATLLTMGVFQYLTLIGYDFPHVVPETARTLDMTLTWLTVLVVLVVNILHYETTRGRTLQSLLEEKKRAEQASSAKSQFLANMSHELRTPLHAIIGLTELTIKSTLNDEQRKNLQRVKEDAYVLLHMVEDILDAARIEAGKLEIRVAPFSPRALVERVVDNMRAPSTSKGLALEIEVDEEVPAHLRGDELRTVQILTNLLDNALKFTQEGSIRITVGTREGQGLELSVSDTGVGIAPADLKHIFESFAQVDASSTRQHHGAGLGLSICRQLVDSLGGSIEVESEPGRGSQFTVYLPFPPAEVKGNGLGTILAVEDDQIGRELVETILRAAGYQVETLADGRAAVDAVGRKTYQLVLMDLQMPGMDGLEAARLIRAGENGQRHVPIVAMTAHALAEERERCFQAGMDDFVTKPIEPKRLVETVQRWMG